MKAVTLNHLGQYQEALDYTFKSDECKLLQVDSNSAELAWNHYDRAKIYMNLGNTLDAKKSMIRALEIREISLGVKNELTICTKKELEILNDI
jgi:tetratricopeptide (TPR) repeat protein